MRVKQTFTITADESTMKKFMRFLAFFHYNGGHSATFGMDFDGDGADSLKVEPPPPDFLRTEVNLIADAGPSLEIATANTYKAKYIDYDKSEYYLDGNKDNDSVVLIRENNKEKVPLRTKFYPKEDNSTN